LEPKTFENAQKRRQAFENKDLDGEDPGLDAEGGAEAECAHVENFDHDPVGQMHAQRCLQPPRRR